MPAPPGIPSVGGMVPLRRHALALALLVSTACSSSDADAPAPAPLRGKAIAGISMGAMGATFLGVQHPERFDAIGSLGGPMDFTWLLAYMERAHLGGFCSLAELERIVAENPGDPGVLNDPAKLPCMVPASPRTGTLLPEHEQSFSHWVYSSNGGSFDRDEYLDLFTDLSLAFGNPLYWNPEAPELPPGVKVADLERGADLCTDPVVIEGFYNAEYNPDGSYPVITFCDGEEPVRYCKGTDRAVDSCTEPDADAACADEGGVGTASRSSDLFVSRAGAYDPCATHSRPVPFALAVDLNRNGRRDYGEPVVVNAHERFVDLGADGCGNDREDGRGGCRAESVEAQCVAPNDAPSDPNGDDFHWSRNPTGTEGNWRWDPGEPFGDDGLDGVPGTFDFGEGDGLYSESPSRAKYWAADARRALADWDRPTRSRMGFYADGGIRDLFNFGVSAAHVWSGFAALDPRHAGAFPGIATFPGAPATDADFEPLTLKADALPEKMLFLYGDPQAGAAAIANGDGDHVGTQRQLLNRLYLLLRWVSARWSALPDPPADRSSLTVRTRSLTFRSEALGGVEREYGVVLPPGYDDPANAEARYPVLLLLHGYGMKAVGSGGFVDSALLWDGAMAAGKLHKMIVVFPSGRCCYEGADGERICTEAEGAASGLPRACRSGSFFVDREGGPGYGTSLLELLDEVDAQFRTVR